MRIAAVSMIAILPFCGSAGAITAPCGHVYRAQAHSPATCMTALADGWYLTPGLVRKKADGIIAPVSMADPQVLKAGTGTMPGMTGRPAITISGDTGAPAMTTARTYIGRGQYGDMAPQDSFTSYGGLERRIALKDWRGKRLRLTVRLKDEGEAHAYASVHIARISDTAIRTATRVNRPDGAWQAHSFVLDVPDNATILTVDAGLTGKGTAWLDGVTLEAVDRTVPVTWSERLDPNFGSSGDYYKSSTAPPVPGPLRHDES
jgi:hypothetical protein